VKKLIIAILAVIVSGCAHVEKQESALPSGSIEQLVFRAENTSLTEKDRSDIVAGLKTIHSDKKIPDAWVSEKGGGISISHEEFVATADGSSCVKADVEVEGKPFLPMTNFCSKNGVWSVGTPDSVSTPVSYPVFAVPKVMQVTPTISKKKTEIIVIIPTIHKKIQRAVRTPNERNFTELR